MLEKTTDLDNKFIILVQFERLIVLTWDQLTEKLKQSVNKNILGEKQFLRNWKEQNNEIAKFGTSRMSA